MENDINNYINQINTSENLTQLESLHKEIFSKTGFFSNAMKSMKNLDVEQKKALGLQVNQYKQNLQTLFNNKQEELVNNKIQLDIEKSEIDLSLPVHKNNQGGLHPITYTIEQIIAIFGSLNFQVAENVEIETDWYNFTALNIPEHHPSRQEHDTFYSSFLDENGKNKVLRTHTSNVQIHSMEDCKKTLEEHKELKIIAPGRTYRSDSDATHSPMFHQVEGLYIAEKDKISVSLLKSILDYFLSHYFNINNLPTRFRPSYFPFTTPSYEVDILCSKTEDSLVIGKGDDWLEVLGCGIVSPKVLQNCGIDTNQYSGIAFGMGIERITMLKHGFKDLRQMFDGKKQWLSSNNISIIKTPTVFGGLN